MKKIIYFLLLCMGPLAAYEIPTEDNISITTLKNGVELWVKQYSKSNSKISLRVVAKNPAEDVPQIFSLETSKENFEPEFLDFVSSCRGTIQKESKVAVVAVGSFNKKNLKEVLADAFQDFPKRQIQVLPRILLIPSPAKDLVQVSLFYPTTVNEIKTDKDVKDILILQLIQFMMQEQFRQVATEVDGELIEYPDSKSIFPLTHTVARGQHSVTPDPARMLIGFLAVLQELRESGFKNSEITFAKSKLSKNLTAHYQATPESQTLADYYANLFVLSIGCPSYKSFMSSAMDILPSIEYKDIERSIGNFFQDEKRRVVMKLPNAMDLSEGSIRDVLQTFKLGSSEERMKETEKDAYLQLPIEDKQAEIIYDIIETMAKNNIFYLGLKSSELEKKGKKIENVHPLRFLGTIFSNPYLRQQCMPKVQDSMFKWNGFLKGLSPSMDRQFDNDNLFQYIPGFCAAVKADPENVLYYVQKKEWEKLVKYLIKTSK